MITKVKKRNWNIKNYLYVDITITYLFVIIPIFIYKEYKK